MGRRRFGKVLTDKNQNELSTQDNYHEDSASLLRLVPCGMQMNVPFDDLSATIGDQAISIAANKPRKSIKGIRKESTHLELKAGSMNLCKFPSEKHLLNRDECILFQRWQRPEPEGEDYFSQLSDEIILYIFQLLPKSVLAKCASVCKRWQELSYDETLWRRHDFGRKVIKQGTLETLLKRGVTTLRLAMSEIRHPIFTEVYLDYYPWRSHLQYLDLSMAMITSESLADLLSKCSSLKKLSLEHCNLDEDCLTNIAENTQLDTLNMAMCDGLTPRGLFTITVCCKNLKEWNLGWSSLNEACMSAFLHLLPSSLKRLNLSGHRQALNDANLIEGLKRCQNLRELDISDNPLVTNSSIVALVKYCPNLQHLHTSRCYNISTESNKLLKGLKTFKYLEIFQTLTDRALAALREFMPEVKINQHMFSTIARPTVGIRRTSIWEVQTRD